MIDRTTPECDLKLPEHLRNKLKVTLGPVVSGKLPEKYQQASCIISVGDVVTDILVEQGIIPDVSIVDQKTRRGDYEPKKRPHEKTIYITNPAGTIKKKVWKTIQRAIDIDEPVLIQVDGEEDLLSLVCIALCKKGCLVIYGIPEEGMVINEVDQEIKDKTWEIINNMIKIRGG